MTNPSNKQCCKKCEVFVEKSGDSTRVTTSHFCSCHKVEVSCENCETRKEGNIKIFPDGRCRVCEKQVFIDTKGKVEVEEEVPPDPECRVCGYNHAPNCDELKDAAPPQVDSKCMNCGEDTRLRNPTGNCDHLYYPENIPKMRSVDSKWEDCNHLHREYPLVCTDCKVIISQNGQGQLWDKEMVDFKVSQAVSETIEKAKENNQFYYNRGYLDAMEKVRQKIENHQKTNTYEDNEAAVFRTTINEILELLALNEDK